MAPLTGLFLVIFLAEPTGLSPHNFTEPNGKIASPAKKNNAGWKATYIVFGRAGVVRKFATKHLGRRSDIEITCKCRKKVSLTNRATEGLMNERTNRWTDCPT